MTVSQVGSVITVSNEAPVVISGISALSNGFQVTTSAAHGYSNNDFVQIKGTTDYNWSFQINGVTSNTFNCVNQRFSFTSSQTGTCERGELDLSNVVGLTGVTTLTNGGITIVDVGTNQLFVEGCLRIDPRNYVLVSGVGPGAVVVQNGGELFLGKVLIAQGTFNYSNPLTAYINTGTPTEFFYPSNFTATPEGALCVMDSDSLIVIESAAIQLTTFGSGTSGNGLQFVNDARVFIRNGKVVSRGFPFSFSGIRSSNIDIEGFEFVNSTLIWGSEVAGNEPIGFQLKSSADGVFGYDGSYTWRNLEVANQGNGADVLLWTDFPVATLTQQKALNNNTGNNIRLKGATTTADSRNKGYATVAKEINVVPRDLAGTALDGASVYIRDTDNGQRKNLNGIDDTADKEYSGTTSGGAGTGVLEVVTAIVNVASTTSTPPDATNKIGNTSANTGAYRVDFRGKSDTLSSPSADLQSDFDATAQFDILSGKYGYRPQTVTALLAGHDVLEISVALLDDPGITEAVEATVAAYTGITPVYSGGTLTVTVTENHTFDEVYDYVKYWEATNLSAVWDNGQQAFLTTSNGVNFSGNNFELIVDATYTVTASGQTVTADGGFTINGEFTGAINDGTNFRVPVQINNLIVGSRVFIRRDSDSAVLLNVIAPSTSVTSFQELTADTDVTVRVRHASSSPIYKPLELSGTITTAAGLTIQVSQQLDE